MTEAVERMCATGFRVWDIVRIYACPYARNGGVPPGAGKGGI